MTPNCNTKKRPKFVRAWLRFEDLPDQEKENVVSENNNVMLAIKKLGGIEAASTKLNVAKVFLSEWIANNYVPKERLVKLSNRVGCSKESLQRGTFWKEELHPIRVKL